MKYPYAITGVEKVTVGATASDVAVKSRTFFIANNHATNSVYFKEKNGADVTTDTGFLLLPKTVFGEPLTADTLSIIASGASTDVRILYVDMASIY